LSSLSRLDPSLSSPRHCTPTSSPGKRPPIASPKKRTSQSSPSKPVSKMSPGRREDISSPSRNTAYHDSPGRRSSISSPVKIPGPTSSPGRRNSISSPNRTSGDLPERRHLNSSPARRNSLSSPTPSSQVSPEKASRLAGARLSPSKSSPARSFNSGSPSRPRPSNSTARGHCLALNLESLKSNGGADQDGGRGESSVRAWLHTADDEHSEVRSFLTTLAYLPTGCPIISSSTCICSLFEILDSFLTYLFISYHAASLDLCHICRIGSHPSCIVLSWFIMKTISLFYNEWE
jgi:hypothetical protein